MRIRTPSRQWSGPRAGTSVVLAVLSLALMLLPTGVLAYSGGHDHHQAMPGTHDGYVRTLAAYTIPDVKLVDPDGAAVPLRSTLAGDGPVILNFIFTSCTVICPVASATFAQVQAALGPERDAIRMVSISIDPEQDTPAAMKAYAGKFGAGRQWLMLTGSLEDSIAVQRAFDVYRGDKMNHRPATFLRAGPRQPWVRLDGFASAADILREYRRLRAK